MGTPEKHPLEELADWLKYYRDLGFTHLYRRPWVAALADEAPMAKLPALCPEPSDPAGTPPQEAPGVGTRATPAEPSSPTSPSRMAPPVRPPLSGSPQQGGLFAAVVPRETLEQIREDLGDCRRCKLWTGRKTIVFGDGNAKAELVFVGEGPGADEDEQGLPFVGRAGQLLTDMIEKGMKMARRDVYICNIIKCRPPGNRKPERDEVAACRPFVERQLDAIRPRVICALGATAAEVLLGVRDSMTKLRGNWYQFHGIPLMVTYHPAFLLRDPSKKGETWADLKKILAYLTTPA